jgi:dynein heavy chain
VTARRQVLSLASVLLETLRSAARAGADSARLPGEEKFTLERGYFVTVTQNTSYIGRNPMPDSLKVLFRPVAMVAPDTRTIAKVSAGGGGEVRRIQRRK